MLKSMARNAALLVVACLVTLALAEGMLRLFPGLLPEEAALRLHWRGLGGPQDPAGGTVILPDPELGFRYAAHTTARLSRQDFAFSFTTDENGFRNPSPWPATADIVVVGDSMAFGYGVGDDDTWTRLLASALGDQAIVNLGMIGAAPQQYVVALRRHGLALRPDYVLFVLFPGNDFNDAETFAAWRQSGTATDFISWKTSREATSGVGRLHQLVGSTYLGSLLLAARRALASGFAGVTIHLDGQGPIQLAPAAYLHAIEIARPDHPAFQLALEAITEARDLAAAQGSGFLVVLAPTKEEVYLPLVEQPHPPLIDSLLPVLDAAGITYLDLTPALQARAYSDGPLFFEIDGHPNRAGYRVIAEAVQDRLRALGHDGTPPDGKRN